MTTVYKLTNGSSMTRNSTLWGEGITHKVSGQGSICTSGWLHAYIDPYVAVFMDPIHGDYGEKGLLWEAKGIIGINDGTKLGLSQLTTVRQIQKPKVTVNQRVAFGILCSLCVYNNKKYVRWASAWLNGIDRTAKSAAATKASHYCVAAQRAAAAAEASHWPAAAQRARYAESADWPAPWAYYWAADAALAVAAAKRAAAAESADAFNISILAHKALRY